MTKYTKCLSKSFGLSLISFGLLSCQTQSAVAIDPHLATRMNVFQKNFQSSSIPIETALGEHLAPNEAQGTKQIEQYILNALKKSHVQGPMKRDVHAKHHGCVTAQFQVNNQALPAHLRVGVFAQNKTYPTWIRYSNGNSDSNNPDIKGDVRGMAVKLMQVPGAKVLPDQKNAPTQDFMLINNKEFFIEDMQDYIQFSEATAKGNLSLAKFAITHPKVMYRIYKIFKKTTVNPVETEFFSTTAYKLGNSAVKYRARPCRAPQSTMPENPGPNYLREAMSQSLSQGDACFEFMVQPNNGNFQQMPVENATIEWPENISPYIPVARLTIPQQNFESPQQMNFCENLSFTPWHTLPEHKPLGVHNRVRKPVYELISSFRHEFNGIQRREPNSFQIF